jgi:threonine/homoserine/homoserine lactone efflux protein
VNGELFTAFLALTIVLLIAPGPIVTLLIATGATHGVKAALTTVAGTALGSALQLTMIAFGLTWILANAAEAFELLRWLGAGYLIWLGLQSWRGAGRAAARPPEGLVNVRRGFLVALTNPKGLAFFSAFLPQFVDPGLPAGPQLAVMCAVSVTLGAMTDSCWAVIGGLGRSWLIRPTWSTWLGRLSGTALIGGGIWLFLARRPS